jgi:hypothetical protein
MIKLDDYLTYLHEDKDKEVKIHPRRKEISSIAAIANPVDDIVFGAIGMKGAMTKLKSKANTLPKKVGVGALGVGAGIAAGAAAIAGYREIRSWFDKCTKQCGTFQVNTPKRQLCMLKCKQMAQKKKAALLQKKQQNKQEVTSKKIELYNQYMKEHPPKEKKNE